MNIKELELLNINKMNVKLSNRRDYSSKYYKDIRYSVYLNKAKYPHSLIFDLTYTKTTNNKEFYSLWITKEDRFINFDTLKDFKQYVKTILIPDLINKIIDYIKRNDLGSVEYLLYILGV